MLTLLVCRYINFANATPDELVQLARACQVFNEAYCKAGKMGSEYFSSSLDPSRTDLIKIIRACLLEGEESRKNVEMEAYKLSIYSAHLTFVFPCLILYYCPGKGSFLKPHVNPPRSEKMFGSLVIFFSTHYEGGALFLRHRGREWILDPGQALGGGALDRQSVGYVAFLNDIEQDVAPVTSGHCVTLTYNLYFGDDCGPVTRVSEKDAISEHTISFPKPPNQDGFRQAFEALLENPEFMAEGGTLAFGLRYGYPIKDCRLQDVRNVLKGSDAVVYQSARALGFEPTLYVYYDENFGSHEAIVIDQLVSLAQFLDEDEETVRGLIQGMGGILVRQAGGEIEYCEPYSGLYYDEDYLRNPEPVEWVTPITAYNRVEDVYAKSRIHDVHGDVCMIVRIGKAGDRLAYPTVAQIKNNMPKNYY